MVILLLLLYDQLVILSNKSGIILEINSQINADANFVEWNLNIW